MCIRDRIHTGAALQRLLVQPAILFHIVADAVSYTHLDVYKRQKESFRGTTHINCSLARPLLRGFSRELKLPRIGAILRLPPCDLQFSFFAAVTLRLRPVLLRKLPARIPLLPRLGLPSVLPAALG